MMHTKPSLLYLVHRIPFPPNKGDKLRSYHLLRQLARDYRVFLGTFVDLPEDWQHVAALNEWCEQVHVAGISPRLARLASLRGLLSGEALSLPYYRNTGMQRWVNAICEAQGISRVVVFSSSMAQYVCPRASVKPVVDFVDVDSAKWTRYAEDYTGALRWIYRREGRKLAAYEREVAAQASASVLVSEAEAALFRQVAPEAANTIHAVSNGVNSVFFSPEHVFENPYAAGEDAVVFTGAMDYWPNIDAALWFAQEAWPAIRQQRPGARFYIVGMNPAETLRALHGRDGIVVTGTVPDVRPYLHFARAVVAPLRVARGIQNKILEAMSMARPVVAYVSCAGGIAAEVGRELLVADDAANFAQAVLTLLAGSTGEEIGRCGRERVLASYSWDAHLAVFPRLVEASVASQQEALSHA